MESAEVRANALANHYAAPAGPVQQPPLKRESEHDLRMGRQQLARLENGVVILDLRGQKERLELRAEQLQVLDLGL